MNYLEETDLYYQLKLSKGKGSITKELENMIILIAKNMANKKQYHCNEKQDVINDMVLRMLCKWSNFNEKKYDYALPFLSEIAKRAMAFGWNTIHGYKQDLESPIIFLESYTF